MGPTSLWFSQDVGIRATEQVLAGTCVGPASGTADEEGAEDGQHAATPSPCLPGPLEGSADQERNVGVGARSLRTVTTEVVYPPFPL